MNIRLWKTLSFFLSIILGLIPAFFLVSGTERVFGDVRIVSGTDTIALPTDPFVIRFSEPVKTESYIGNISVSPQIDMRIEWNTDRTEVSIFPETKWAEGTRYRVFVGSGRADYRRSVGVASFTFLAPEYPRVVDMIPKDGSTDVLLGIEDPISVKFDRSVKNFYIDFRLDPSPAVVYESDAGKTVFRILPKEVLQSGKEYSLSVYAKWRGEGDDAYAKLGETKFATLPERPAVWSRNLTERLAQAKRFTRPQITTGKYIDVNLESQVMTIFEDGKLLDAYLVSSGKWGMETPKGTYKTENKADRVWSKEYGLFMPDWMALVPSGKFGIHELPEWPGGYKEGANHLGVPVSHGCVRLGVGPAKRVYDWAPLGTPVIVY